MDSRDAKSVAGDLDLGSTLLSWEDVQRYLESNGINLEEAQLKAILAQRIKTVKKERFFDYTSPDGLKTRIPVMLVTRACTPGHCYRIRQFDAVRLLNAAKRDKETFVKYLDAMREIGLAGPSECLSTKPRTFHLDGRDRGIRLYMKNLERYMKRDDAEFFGRWKELADHRESDYDGIRSWVCVSSEKEGRIQAYSRFLERLSIEATGVVLSVCTTFGLNIKIRELEGVYYVHRGEQSRTLRFFLNINNPCGRVRTKAVGSLAREIDALTSIGSADPHLVFRLWAARSVHNRDWRFEPDTAQCSFPQFDILIHSETAEQIFTRFQIEKLGRFFEKKCPGLVCTF